MAEEQPPQENDTSGGVGKGCAILFSGVLVLALIITVCTLALDSEDDPALPRPVYQDSPTRTVQEITQPGPSASELAIDSIKAEQLVVNAAITKRGNEVSMVLIVGYATNETYAKQLGERFVRMYKSFSADSSPGKSVGDGRYDYLIGVYYPNEQRVAQGAKLSFAENITW